MTQTQAAKKLDVLSSSFLLSLVVMLGAVFLLYHRGERFHGFFPLMPKEAILSLRTALAGLSIFAFFPLIWSVHHRSDEKNRARAMTWTLLALAIAESPCLFGLVLFLLKGAFKTFFVFFAVSAFYMLIAWPRD